MNVLIVNPKLPYPRNLNGNTVRVLPLCEAIAREHRCFLAAFDERGEQYEKLCASGIMDDILLLPSPNGYPVRLWRNLFLRSGHLDRIARPEYFRQITGLLSQFIAKHNIDVTITISLELSQYTESLPETTNIVDVTDSQTLIAIRRHKLLVPCFGRTEKIASLFRILRMRWQESRLTDKFSYVTTISHVDQDILRKFSKAGEDRIVVVPNGVSEEFVNFDISGNKSSKSIAFWGALDFEPNSTAIDYFYEQVYLRFLADQDITWFIIGKNPGEKIIKIANSHKNIILTGFVEDLPQFLSDIPIMINPMRMGGGLKNKVLEAFALGMVVVSNQMGMEAMEAENEVHCLRAEEPEQFANAIFTALNNTELRNRIGQNARKLVTENYTWIEIGEKYLEIIDKALSWQGRFKTPK